MDTYLNIGSIENFREYYTTYAEVAIGEYEHWEEEEWVDAANPDWQKFIGQLSQELNEKGVDGFFIILTQVQFNAILRTVCQLWWAVFTYIGNAIPWCLKFIFGS